MKNYIYIGDEIDGKKIEISDETALNLKSLRKFSTSETKETPSVAMDGIEEIKTTKLLVRLIEEWLNFIDNLSEDNEFTSKQKTFINFYHWLKEIQASN